MEYQDVADTHSRSKGNVIGTVVLGWLIYTACYTCVALLPRSMDGVELISVPWISFIVGVLVGYRVGTRGWAYAMVPVLLFSLLLFSLLPVLLPSSDAGGIPWAALLYKLPVGLLASMFGGFIGENLHVHSATADEGSRLHCRSEFRMSGTESENDLSVGPKASTIGVISIGWLAYWAFYVYAAILPRWMSVIEWTMLPWVSVAAGLYIGFRLRTRGWAYAAIPAVMMAIPYLVLYRQPSELPLVAYRIPCAVLMSMLGGFIGEKLRH